MYGCSGWMHSFAKLANQDQGISISNICTFMYINSSLATSYYPLKLFFNFTFSRFSFLKTCLLWSGLRFDEFYFNGGKMQLCFQNNIWHLLVFTINVYHYFYYSFQNCLGLMYTVYVDNVEVEMETLVGNILGHVQVPPPGGPQVRNLVKVSQSFKGRKHWGRGGGGRGRRMIFWNWACERKDPWSCPSAISRRPTCKESCPLKRRKHWGWNTGEGRRGKGKGMIFC